MSERKSRYELFLEEEARTTQKPQSKVRRSEAKYKSYEDWFWKRFKRRTKESGACLEWTGAMGDGWPVCSWKGRKSLSLRRIVYRLAIGELSDDLVVIVTCNNKRCVRYSHMKAVTKEEYEVKFRNHAPTGDKHGSRTHPDKFTMKWMDRSGEHNGRAKLIEADIRRIRRLHADGLSARKIARNYGMAKSTIQGIVNGRAWTHVQ